MGSGEWEVKTLSCCVSLFLAGKIALQLANLGNWQPKIKKSVQKSLSPWLSIIIFKVLVTCVKSVSMIANKK